MFEETKGYWYEVRRPIFYGFAKQPKRVTKKHGQVHISGRPVLRGTNCMEWDTAKKVTR